MVDLDGYYEREYTLLAASEDEDQIYTVIDGKPVYQSAHRVRNLLAQVDVPEGARVLDYGCAKGIFSRQLRQHRDDILPFLFEVTDRYVPFWSTFATPCQWAIGSAPAHWAGMFDVVCSFYVLEHVVDPRGVVGHMLSLVKPGGSIYLVVPNVRANIADLIVADHLQHFSATSLRRLLESSGLTDIRIDDRSHNGAYVVAASKPHHGLSPRVAPQDSLSSELQALCKEYREIARYWSCAADRIRSMESLQASGTAACIYGAGFYGTFISSCLLNPEAITCFVDQNPFMQGRAIGNRPIIAPAQLDPSVSLMYVGLNPATARSIIGDIGCWAGREFNAFYL